MVEREARGVSRQLGDLAVVLHSHMPYVEGFGTYPFGEEWLFDAVGRSHLPVLERAHDLTMTVTPVLADQLEAPGVVTRMEAFLRRYRLEAAERDAREAPLEVRAAAAAEADRYRRALDRLTALGGDALEAFRIASMDRNVALIASAATHAVLPLVGTTAGRRLQIDAGLRSHERRFGPTDGFWLPECAYRRGIEPLLAERVTGLRVADLACGEGYGAAVLARAAADVVGVDANPEAYEHARLRYERPNLRFERGLVEAFEGPCDAIVFLQTIEHISEPEPLLERFRAVAPLTYVTTPNRLTLAPPKAEKSDNPWHLREYALGEYRALLEPHFEKVEVFGVFHARKLRAHEVALRAGWDRVHPALRLTKPFYDRFIPAISASDFRITAEGELPRALDFLAICHASARLEEGA